MGRPNRGENGRLRCDCTLNKVRRDREPQGWEGRTPTQVSTSSEPMLEFRPEFAHLATRKRLRDTYKTRDEFAHLYLLDF